MYALGGQVCDCLPPSTAPPDRPLLRSLGGRRLQEYLNSWAGSHPLPPRASRPNKAQVTWQLLWGEVGSLALHPESSAESEHRISKMLQVLLPDQGTSQHQHADSLSPAATQGMLSDGHQVASPGPTNTHSRTVTMLQIPPHHPGLPSPPEQDSNSVGRSQGCIDPASAAAGLGCTCPRSQAPDNYLQCWPHAKPLMDSNSQRRSVCPT